MSKAHKSTYFEMRGLVDKALLTAMVFLSFLFVTWTDANATTYPIMHNSSTANAKGYWNISGGWGVTPTSKYGRFTCQTCHVSDSANTNIKRVKTAITPPKGGVWASSGTASLPVTFTNTTGQYSFGDDRNNYTTSFRVCEACHSKTNAHRYDNTGNATNHQAAARTDCTGCHAHSAGFSPSGGCTTCHGNPPTTTAVGTSTGLAGPTATLALGASPINAGAHDRHAIQLVMTCYVCHKGYTTAPMGNGAIQLGYEVSSANWSQFQGTVVQGSYTGASVLGGPYSWQATPSGTPQAVIGTKAGGNSCNVYCHGNWAGSGGSRPAWTGGSADAQCGKCHGVTAAAPPSSGTHTVHAGNGATGYGITCTTCHPSRLPGNTLHIKGAVQWQFSTTIPRVGVNAKYTRSATTGSGTSAGTTNTLGGTVASYGTCDTIYCHSNAADTGATNPVVTWGGANAPECTLCHGGNATAGTGAGKITTGRHAAHTDNAGVLGTNQNFTCGDCHAKTVSTGNDRAITNKTLHVNALKDYSGVRAGGSASYNAATNVCSNSYCHSSGKKGVGGVTEPTTPTWDSATTLGCNGCHGTTNTNTGHPNYVSQGSGVAGSNSHDKHVTSLGIVNTTGCYKCHRLTVDKSTANKLKSYSSSHLNGKIDPVMATMGNRTGHYNSVPKTCQNTYCHGTAASTPWGGAAQACDSCHAANANAGKHWGANSAHKIHEANSSLLPPNYTNISGNVSTQTEYRFACSACHNPATSTHAGGPVTTNQAAQVYFGYTSPGHAPTYTAGALNTNDNGFNWTSGGAASCNTTYCHSTGGGAGTAVTWSTNTASGSCTICHGSVRGSANVMNTGRHKSHMNNYTTLGASMPNCTSCHAKTLSGNTTINDKRLHLNKFKNVSGQYFGKSSNYVTATKVCSNVYCHSNGKRGSADNVYINMTGSKTWTGNAALGCNGCHGRSNAIGYPDNSAPNSHPTHATKLGLNDSKGCAKCHRTTADVANAGRLHPLSSNHINGRANLDVRFTDLGGAVGIYNTGAKTCSNTYCHGTASTSPSWGSTITCGQYCHNVNTGTKSSAQGQSGAAILNGVHYKHYTSTGAAAVYTNPAGNQGSGSYYKWQCKSCHNGTHANGPADTNGYAQVMFGYTGGGKTGTYVYNATWNKPQGTDVRGYQWTKGTCSNTYCHSDGNGNSVSVTWDNTVTLGCTGCHGGARGSVNPMNTGKHNRHMNNWTTMGANLFKCSSCHAGTVNSNTTISNSLRHVNRIKNYSGLYAGDNYNPVTKTCTTFYCHSNSKGRFVDPGTWTTGQGPKNCDGCHGRSANGQFSNSNGIGYPNYTSTGINTAYANSHQKHITAINITDTRGCAKCHRRTADRNFANRQHPLSSNHLDGNTSFDVSPDTGFGVSYTYSADSTKTCSNISCHSSGRATPQKGSAQWGGSTTCLSCHGGRSSASGSYTFSTSGFRLSTTHSQHLKYPAANINCQMCHSKTATDAATLKPYTSLTYHVNGVRNVTFTNPVYGTYTAYKAASSGSGGTTKTCGNVSCHGGTSRGAWSETVINNDNTCVHCHGKNTTPTTNTNRNNYAPGWNGGISTDGNIVATDPRVGAHFLHLSSSYMKKLKCNECHLVPNNPFDATTQHMATQRFTSPTLSFAQASTATRNNTFTSFTSGTASKAATCSTVYCHGAKMFNGSTNGNNTKPSWNNTAYLTGVPAAPGDCTQCHGAPPNTPAGSHNAVTANDLNACTTCHNNLNAGGTFKNKALHINGIVEAPTACNGCHDYDTTAGNTLWGFSPKGVDGYGAHVKHINYLRNKTGVTLDPVADTFGGASFKAVCGVCHTVNMADHKDAARSINFHNNSGARKFGSSNPQYNGVSGSATPAKTCSNLDCHYKTTPVWP